MIRRILETRTPNFWLVFHVIFGLACTLSSLFFILWFFTVVLSSVNYFMRGKTEIRAANYVKFVSYLAALEIMTRFTKAYNYGLPYEYGKYVVFVGVAAGLILFPIKKGFGGLLLFFLLLPSLFVNRAVELRFEMLVFNGLGPAGLALGVFFFSNVKVSRQDLKEIVLMILYPCISALAYTVIKNPDLTSYEFTLGAKFATAGGFGSNQVSTVLGIGFFLCLIIWLNKWQIFSKQLIALVIGLLFVMQGLLTFSRGGVIGGVLAVLIFIWAMSTVSAKLKKRYSIQNIAKYVLPFILFAGIAFFVVNEITRGMLTLRYQGHTSSTTKGFRERDANTLTSGRFSMMEADLAVWQDNFIFGVGLGSSRYVREEHGAVAHVELSRLLADHGVLGLMFFLYLSYLGTQVFFKNRNKNMKYQGLLFAFFVLGLYTSFHAATRTYVTPLLIGLSMLNFKEGFEVEGK